MEIGKCPLTYSSDKSSWASTTINFLVKFLTPLAHKASAVKI